MDFVGRRIQCNEQDGGGSERPAPRARVVFDRLADAAPEQQRENGVFREVRAFADAEDNRVNRLLRKVRKKPADKGSDESRGMLH